MWTQGTKANGKNQPTIKVLFFKTPFPQLIEDKKKPQTTWKTHVQGDSRRSESNKIIRNIGSLGDVNP